MIVRHVLLAAIAAAALAGCSGAAGTAVPVPPTATVAAPTSTAVSGQAVLAPESASTTITNGSATCDYDVTWLTVHGIPADAAATANAALDLTPDPIDCEESAAVSGGYRDEALNERGVLSTAYVITRSVPGAAYPGSTMQTFVIDLASGEEIPLADVLTERGRAAFVAGCRAGLDPQLVTGVDLCASLYAEPGPDAPYTATREGLVAHVYNEVPHAVQALAERGVLVPWAALGDGLRPGTPIAALAGR
ncbi:hypothetical protein SAMN05443637_10642 [Pseudonocardia thermophila]|jgi:hypothetical protein|uniref:Uncharacterized protein n=1 Tax=Pseudonocardia thermophila TaxID=1848 RepID=A0A1M6SB21_PSETH|nr:hypothetical protein [Pseudonocardia thermophila]SHK41954.1 hypothetical protein SAMN05443637_10642 [Pseudonocardia thermophila]